MAETCQVSKCFLIFARNIFGSFSSCSHTGTMLRQAQHKLSTPGFRNSLFNCLDALLIEYIEKTLQF